LATGEIASCRPIWPEFGVQGGVPQRRHDQAGRDRSHDQFAGDKFGVDMLVNNAGIQYVANVEDFPVEKWDAIIAINLSSAFHTTRLVLPRMRTNNWGRIINLASCMAWWPRPASRPTWPPSTA
jgi:3-hydroxybutyrate dehydrogenase